jgi:hypothetical protein
LFSHSLVGPVIPPGITESQQGQEALHGASLWRETKNVIELKKNWRSGGDPAYVDLLQRIRLGIAWKGHGSPMGSGSYGLSDYDVLCQRRLHVLAAKDKQGLSEFEGAPIIVAKKTLRDAINMRMTEMYTKKTGRTLNIYHSRDRFQKVDLEGHHQERMWRTRSSLTGDHLGMLPLVVGMKVVLTENLAISAKVVNGAEGVLQSVKYEVDDQGHKFAVCAYVHIPNCNLQAPGLDKDVVPLLMQRNTFQYVSKDGIKYSVSRLQLPLLPAYAFIDYKVQGRGFDHVVIDLAGCGGLQSMYVMLSRAMSLKGIAVLRNFPSTRLYGRLPQEFRNEFRRLRTLDESTWLEFDSCNDVNCEPMEIETTHY